MTPNATTPPSALDQLPPLMLPEAIGWWPLAPGWWIVIAATAFTLCALIYCAHRYYHRGRLRRATLKLAQQHWLAYEANPNTATYLVNMVQLIRRFCLHQYNQPPLTSSSGEPWLQQLDALTGSSLLNSHEGKRLLSIYQNTNLSDKAFNSTALTSAEKSNAISPAQLKQTHELIIQWLRKVPLHQRKTAYTITSTGAQTKSMQSC